ncbi:hypothetical protein BD410DRAFT_810494 [Rickenella mellea]|uniref:Uncharacterized protein n=1 Tax=Rickenella mellea TaxID=50990 RepID=A0A4V3AZG0_9AGAM|nr:hypothetical protein BD410DRAFT_810494 [Rickenella mellea]
MVAPHHPLKISTSNHFRTLFKPSASFRTSCHTVGERGPLPEKAVRTSLALQPPPSLSSPSSPLTGWPSRTGWEVIGATRSPRSSAVSQLGPPKTSARASAASPPAADRERSTTTMDNGIAARSMATLADPPNTMHSQNTPYAATVHANFANHTSTRTSTNHDDERWHSRTITAPPTPIRRERSSAFAIDTPSFQRTNTMISDNQNSVVALVPTTPPHPLALAYQRNTSL